MRLDLMGYSSWYRTNNFADFSHAIIYFDSSDLDCLARSLERWGAGGSFRRISRDIELRNWCQESFKRLQPRLRRTQKRVLGIAGMISVIENGVMFLDTEKKTSIHIQDIEE